METAIIAMCALPQKANVGWRLSTAEPAVTVLGVRSVSLWVCAK